LTSRPSTSPCIRLSNDYVLSLMIRYFNTMKNEYINLHEYQTEEQLYAAVKEFAYVHYNHVCPHALHHFKHDLCNGSYTSNFFEPCRCNNA